MPPPSKIQARQRSHAAMPSRRLCATTEDVVGQLPKSLRRDSFLQEKPTDLQLSGAVEPRTDTIWIRFGFWTSTLQLRPLETRSLFPISQMASRTVPKMVFQIVPRIVFINPSPHWKMNIFDTIWIRFWISFGTRIGMSRFSMHCNKYVMLCHLFIVTDYVATFAQTCHVATLAIEGASRACTSVTQAPQIKA